MFGYVRLYKPEIKMGEYEQYQGIYCTLCRRLGRRYGLLAKMSLSYDLTFLALLQMAQQPQEPGFCPGRCSFNPVKRCLRCQNTEAIDRAADISVLLTYYKLQDTLADEGFWGRIGAVLLLPPVALRRRKAARRQPGADRRIAAMMADQRTLEKARVASIDRAAEPFALLLQWLAAETATDSRQHRVLERFGYCLGRWIYLIDAVDDLEKDKKQHAYNPFLLSRSCQATEASAIWQYAGAVLNACLAECIAAYNLLNIRRFDGIIRNILEEGMPAAQRKAQRLATPGEEQHHHEP